MFKKIRLLCVFFLPFYSCFSRFQAPSKKYLKNVLYSQPLLLLKILLFRWKNVNVKELKYFSLYYVTLRTRSKKPYFIWKKERNIVFENTFIIEFIVCVWWNNFKVCFKRNGWSNFHTKFLILMIHTK